MLAKTLRKIGLGGLKNSVIILLLDQKRTRKMNAQQILNAAFNLLMLDHWCEVSPTAHIWDDEEAEHWLMQIAMGQTLSVQVDFRWGKTMASPCLR